MTKIKYERKQLLDICKHQLNKFSEDYQNKKYYPVPKELGKICRMIEKANGFAGAKETGILVKLMLVVTELSEGMEYYYSGQGDPLQEELADAAIRLFAILSNWTNNEWIWRDPYKTTINETLEQKLKPIPEQMMNIIHYLSLAAEKWRKGDEFDTNISMEIALSKIFIFANRMNYDLWQEIINKCLKNCNRPYRHGKKENA